MSRSLKKGPYCAPKLLKRIQEENKSGKKEIIKTWKINYLPWFYSTYNLSWEWKLFVPIYITEDMIGHKLG